MKFTSEPRLGTDGVVERDFVLDDIPGLLWTPADQAEPAPLVLLGQPGGMHRMYPRLNARARATGAEGFAAATIEFPGSGDRPPSHAAEQARADLRRAIEAGAGVDHEIVDRLVLPLVEARKVTIPLHVLLQWDDEHDDRQQALDLFDAFGSREKTLNADMGGHTGVPAAAGDAGNRFLARHLR